MDRKKFLKRSLLGAAGMFAGNTLVKAEEAKTKVSTFDKLIEQVGFNHLPNEVVERDSNHLNQKVMGKSVLHKATTRGRANHGWLDSHHSFSFANYHNPERMNFGVIRVLNDDVVAGGKGFGRHPHDNMEIISIPLAGGLEHKDSMGNVAVIKAGDVQAMSAGTGIFHSEYNQNEGEEVRFLQIWLFPNKKNVEPRYDQITLASQASKNKFQQILSPDQGDEGVWIHQNAWFQMGNFSAGHQERYQIKAKNNGVYAFILEGEVTINGQKLSKRDGYGLWELETIEVIADSDAKVLLMDVPMNLS
ncbi:MAG: pirin family protein [Saprospiraceae bacterium]